MQVPPPQSPNAILDEAIRLSRAGRSKDGIHLALSVAQRFRDDGQSAPLRRALNVIAICQAAHGRYIEAVSHALDTYALAHDAQDRIEECHALATLAASAGMILDTDEAAFPVLQYCLESARQFGDVGLEARVRSLMGIRLGSMRRFDEAEREIHAAIKLGAALRKKHIAIRSRISVKTEVRGFQSVQIKRVVSQVKAAPGLWFKKKRLCR